MFLFPRSGRQRNGPDGHCAGYLQVICPKPSFIAPDGASPLPPPGRGPRYGHTSSGAAPISPGGAACPGLHKKYRTADNSDPVFCQHTLPGGWPAFKASLRAGAPSGPGNFFPAPLWRRSPSRGSLCGGTQPSIIMVLRSGSFFSVLRGNSRCSTPFSNFALISSSLMASPTRKLLCTLPV